MNFLKRLFAKKARNNNQGWNGKDDQRVREEFRKARTAKQKKEICETLGKELGRTPLGVRSRAATLGAYS